MIGLYGVVGVGALPMPADFKYRDVFYRGRPRHEGYDSFRVRHPSMDIGHRAKIFAPFDALTGFSDAISDTEQHYVERPDPEEEERARLDRKLALLHRLTADSRLAKMNAVQVRVTWFEPCGDRNHPAFGLQGTCRTCTGPVRRADPGNGGILAVGDAVIAFSDILRMEYAGLGKDIFAEEPENFDLQEG